MFYFTIMLIFTWSSFRTHIICYSDLKLALLSDQSTLSEFLLLPPSDSAYSVLTCQISFQVSCKTHHIKVFTLSISSLYRPDLSSSVTSDWSRSSLCQQRLTINLSRSCKYLQLCYLFSNSIITINTLSFIFQNILISSKSNRDL